MINLIKYYYYRNRGRALFKRYYRAAMDISESFIDAERVCPYILVYKARAKVFVNKAIFVKNEMRLHGLN